MRSWRASFPSMLIEDRQHKDLSKIAGGFVISSSWSSS
jgi:hypothetical protein